MAWYLNRCSKSSYVYHIHSLVSNSEFVEKDTNKETITEGMADNYQSDASSGCFTKPYYHIARYKTGSHYEKRGCQHNWVDYPPAGDGYYSGFACTKCGAQHGPCYAGSELPGQTDDYWEGYVDDYSSDKWTYSPSASDLKHLIKTVYTCNCGYKNGQCLNPND